MEWPAPKQKSDDVDPTRAELLFAATGAALGGLIFYAHARRVGGASEGHIGFQIFWGAGIGFMLPVLVFTAINDYHKARGTNGRYDTFWSWLFRSVNGVLFILLELFLIGAAIWVMADPNGSASIPEG